MYNFPCLRSLNYHPHGGNHFGLIKATKRVTRVITHQSDKLRSNVDGMLDSAQRRRGRSHHGILSRLALGDQEGCVNDARPHGIDLDAPRLHQSSA